MNDSEQKEIFKNNLKKYVESSGKTQKEIADSIGVSAQTFNTWMQGIAIPRMGKIQALADYFHINKTDLIDKIPDDTDGYYHDPEVAALADELKNNTGMRILLDASRDLTMDELLEVIETVQKMKKGE